MLRSYQQKIINKLREQVRLNPKDKFCVSVATGAGKSFLLAEIAQNATKNNKRTLIVTHRKNLLIQNRDKMQGEADFYCAGLNEKKLDAPVIFGSIQTLVRALDILPAFDIILCDECFTGETKISTPNGEKAIDSMCLNDIVYNATGSGKVTSIFRKLAPEYLYNIRFTNGTSFKCTANHPILSMHGWVRASELGKGEIVFSLPDMSLLWCGNTSKNKKKFKRSSLRRYDRKKLQLQAILQLILREENRQPNVQGIYKKKSVPNPEKDRAQTICSWWKRQGANRMRKNGVENAVRNRFRVGRALINSNQNRAPKRDLSESLQNRFSKSSIKKSHRSRWRISSLFKNKAHRRKERSCFEWVRVESVKIEKSGSQEYVYNLEVNGHPSYFANGILVHNCHRVPTKKESSYQKLLTRFPNAIVIGFTATPYRLKGSGNFSIVGSPESNFFTKMIDEVGITELVEAGFLSKLKSQVDTNITQSDFETLKTLDFDLEKAKELITSKSDYISVIKKAFIKQMPTRAIVFCCDIEHTESVANKLNEFIPTSYYHSKHKSDNVLDDFKSGKIKVLCNCEVFTEGFDLPSIDYVILLRPTKSTALYVQMVGRGLRVTENKNECIVLDFGGNIAEHGAINYIQINQQEKGKVKNNEPLNVCSACFMVTKTNPCEHCGAESEKQIVIRKSPEERIKKLSQKEIYSDTFSEYKIDRIVTSKYQKKYSSGLVASDFTLRVDFISSGCNVHSEFLCLNHSGYARELACNKFRGIFGIDAPVSVDKALGIIPRKINYIKVKNTQKKGDKYPTRTLILVKELPVEVVETSEIPKKIKELPLVQDVLKHFPNSQIII